jgi:hypothetical protein
MDTPNCPTCAKPMEPNPARPSAYGMGSCVYGAPGDPAFVCLVNDKAHDDARAARALESKRLLAEADAIRATRETKAVAAAKIGTKENPTATAAAEKEII